MKTIITNIITHFFEYIVQFAGNLISDVLKLILKYVAVSPTYILSHLSSMNGIEADAMIQGFAVLYLSISFVFSLIEMMYSETTGTAKRNSIMKMLIDMAVSLLLIYTGKKILCEMFNQYYAFQNELFFTNGADRLGFDLAESITGITGLMKDVLNMVVSPFIGGILTLIYLYNILKVIIGIGIRQMEQTFLLLVSPMFFSFFSNDDTKSISISFVKTLISYIIISFSTMWSLRFLTSSYRSLNGMELADVFYISAMSFVIVKIDVLYDSLGLRNNTASKSIRGAISSVGSMVTNLAGKTRLGHMIRSHNLAEGKGGSDFRRINDLVGRNQISTRIPVFRPAEETEEEQNFRYDNLQRNALGNSTSPITEDHKIIPDQAGRKISAFTATINQMRGRGADGQKNTDLIGVKSVMNGFPLTAFAQGKKDIAVRNNAIDRYRNAVKTINNLNPGEKASAETFSTALNLKNANEYFRLSEGSEVEALGEGRFIVQGEIKNSNGKVEADRYQVTLNNSVKNTGGMSFSENSFIEIGRGIHAYRRK